MGIFSNFIKHRSSIVNVLQALDNFKVDQPSFELVKKHSTAFFGDNWKFNLEMYIASLPQNDRAKYYEIFKKVIEYEVAINYWNRAVKITNYTMGVSRDDLIESGLYKKYLSKFGVEGIRLYQKLEKFLSVNKDVEDDIKYIEEHEEAVVNISPDYTKKLKDIIKNKVSEVSNSVKTIKKEVKEKQSVTKKNGDFVATLNEVVNQPQVKENIATLNEIINEPKVANIKEKKVIKPSQQKSNDWDIQNFYQIHEFMPTIRNIMAAISIYKKSSAIEEYNGYVFLNDAIDYLINEGEKILVKTTDENAKKTLLDIINQYKEEKLNEVEYSPKQVTDEMQDKPYKNPYEDL